MTKQLHEANRLEKESQPSPRCEHERLFNYHRLLFLWHFRGLQILSKIENPNQNEGLVQRSLIHDMRS
jgi:hypothetical protein